MITFEEFKQLSKFMSLYRSAYNIETDSGWKRSNHYLTDDRLLKAMNSTKSNIAVFSTIKTNFFSIDIDNHDGKTNINLLYSEVYNKLGVPSLVCKSPRGIHAYYFLSEFYDCSLLHQKVKKVIGNKFEIKPSADVALRSITKSNLVDVETLERLTDSLTNILLKCKVYSLNELFFNVVSKEKAKVQIKLKIDTIGNGETNDALNYLIPIWKTQGYNDVECASMFISKLDKSYTGDVTHHLLKRIAFYSGSKIIVKRDNVEIKEKYSALISRIIKQSDDKFKLKGNNRKLRNEKLEKIVVAILNQRDLTLERYQDAKLNSQYSSLYPFWNYEVSKGRIPLPANFFKAINTNYRKTFDFLFSIGFLTRPNGRSYSTALKSCQYYQVNTQLPTPYIFDYSLLVESCVRVVSESHFLINLTTFFGSKNTRADKCSKVLVYCKKKLCVKHYFALPILERESG